MRHDAPVIVGAVDFRMTGLAIFVEHHFAARDFRRIEPGEDVLRPEGRVQAFELVFYQREIVDVYRRGIIEWRRIQETLASDRMQWLQTNSEDYE